MARRGRAESAVKVLVSGLEFLAFHGVTEAERSLGHRMRMDLTAEIEESASVTDSIEDTVDYAAMGSRAVELCNEAAAFTVEFVCRRIAIRLLEEFPRIQTITVKLQKLNPSLELQMQSVGVEKTYVRQG